MTHLLLALEAAVLGGNRADVTRLIGLLLTGSRNTANHALLDLTTCVSAHYARGNYARAELLIRDGLAASRSVAACGSV